MSINARDKGIRGERRIIDWLNPIIKEICEEMGKEVIVLQRNTLQWDAGGQDITGCDFLNCEVKNTKSQTISQMDSYWAQCVSQRRKGQIDVLFYFGIQRHIRCRMLGWAGQDDPGVPCIVDISAETFEVWFKAKLRAYLVDT